MSVLLSPGLLRLGGRSEEEEQREEEEQGGDTGGGLGWGWPAWLWNGPQFAVSVTVLTL